jgi:ankyrin repeat protein
LIVLALGGCGDDPNAPGADGEPLLISAAERGDLPAIDALLARKALPDVRDSCDWTPLMKAALEGHQVAVERLLAAGADPQGEDKGGYTAMMLAASNNHAEIVSLLLANGAMVDHQERTRGWTALIWAATQGHTETVRVLMEAGADATLRDFDGRTAADWAQQKGQTRGQVQF